MGLVYSEPACQSAYKGDVRRLYHLLREDPSHLNVQEEHTGDTPLIAACRRGNQRVVHYLLENGADVHLTNKKQRTCLHYVSKRSFSLLDYLMICILMPILLLGYFLILQKRRQKAALMKEVLSSNVDVNAVDYTWTVQEQPEDRGPCLWPQKSLDPNPAPRVLPQKGNTALHYVCQRKSPGLVPLLLDADCDVNIHNNDGETPLDVATRLKLKKIVNMLKKTH